MTYSQLATALNEYAEAKEAWDEEVPFKDIKGAEYELSDAQGFNNETGVITLEKVD